MNGKARECERYNPKFDASVLANFFISGDFCFFGGMVVSANDVETRKKNKNKLEKHTSLMR